MSTGMLYSSCICFTHIIYIILPLYTPYVQVSDELMSQEVRQVEAISIYIDQLDDQLTDLKALHIEAHNTYFRAIEDLQEKFTVYIRNMGLDLMERLSNQLEEEEMDMINSARQTAASDLQPPFQQAEGGQSNTKDPANSANNSTNNTSNIGIVEPLRLNDEASGLLHDKDTCMNVINASHELHITRILRIEDETRKIDLKWFTDFITRQNSDEHKRNRNQILDIRSICLVIKGSIDELLSYEEDDDVFIEE